MDWNLPTLTSLYTDAMALMKERTTDVATMFRSSSSTNLPVGTIKWNDGNSRFESWNGSVWSALDPLYEMNVRSATKWSSPVTVTLGEDLSGSLVLDGATTALQWNVAVVNNSHVGTVADFENSLI